MIDYNKIETILQTSKAFELIRVKNLPEILSFLYKEFKEDSNSTLKYEEAITKLSNYLDILESENENDFLISNFEKARKVLDKWCKKEFLVRTEDSKGNWNISLTPETNKVILWIEDLEEKDFIGTESRFQLIFNQLKDIIEKSTLDPVERIKQLEERKTEIEIEIQNVKNGIINPVENYLIQEMYENVLKNARSLVSDFSEVEKNFKEIISKIYEDQISQKYSKGSIVINTFNSLEALKEKDQGKSFYGFWQILFNQNGSSQLDKLIGEVHLILDDKKIKNKDFFLEDLRFQLHEAGKKVIATNILLAERLNRLVNNENLKESKKIFETINEIKKLMIQNVNNSNNINNLMCIELNPEFNFPFERNLLELSFKSNIKEIILPEIKINLEDISELFSYVPVNETELKNRILEQIKDNKEISLGELTKNIPIEKGVEEILKYYSLALNDLQKFSNIDNINKEIITFDYNKQIGLEVPKIIFTKN